MKIFFLNCLASIVVILFMTACGGSGSDGSNTNTATGLIPDSGQVQCYYTFSMYPQASGCFGTDGQDGDYVSHTMSFTDTGNGTISDNVTGLTWQKCALGSSGSDCLSGTLSNYTWSNAQTQCAALGTGWRLPTILELTRIIDYSRSYSSIDPTAFPNTAPGTHWSSTIHPYYTGMAWNVNFAQANTSVDYQTNTEYVRCVRG